MKNSQIIFNVLTLFFLIILIFWITQINYNDLSFKENLSPYLGVTSMTLMIFSMQMIKKNIKKK